MIFSTKYRNMCLAAMAIVAILFGTARSAEAQATGTIIGTVKDAQGGVIPGATVSIVSETRGTSIDAVTNATGDFVMSNIPGDVYTVKVTLSGFKTTERKAVRVTPGDRVALGTVTLEQGTFAETVVVSTETPILQTQTGDRSFTVSKESVENLPMAGRNFASFAALTPGVNGTTRADGARTNYVLDGVSSVNTGGNQQGLNVNPEAIAEVKVIVSAYQAEYGRTNGITIAGVTKSGSNQFRGSVFDVERHSRWNTNSWTNQKQGLAKTKSDQRDWGYTIGGPIGKPGGNNKLFFFYSEQFLPRTSAGNTNDFTVPTLLERQGDFSKTVTNTGASFNTIRDATTGLPCSATDIRGCFQDGGVLGKIPVSRLNANVNGIGLNILRLYPEPNLTGVVGANYRTTQPKVDSNTWLHIIKVDYQASNKLRISAKYGGQNATVQTNPGSMPGYNDTIFQFPAQLVPSATVVYTINNTTIFEGSWGRTQGNQLGSPPNAPTTNRNAVGLGNFPTLYPSPLVPVGSFQEKVLKTMNAPYYIDGYLQMRPQFSWGNRIGSAPPNSGYPGFLCDQFTNDLALSITKLKGTHTYKFGYVTQDSTKRQNVGTQTNGVLPIEGSVNFMNDNNNPNDTGFGFANAALGIFSTFSQMKNFVEGHYVYHNKDFYAQDNWKITSRLTLDYGMRFTHHGQQYDDKLQGSNFFPDKWSAIEAPLLYQPGCSTGTITAGCTVVAVNPKTGASLGTGSSVSVGTIVPGSGTVANGFIQQGQPGNIKENYKEPWMALGPRVGGAYDLTGKQQFVFRGSLGYFYDRLQGDSVFAQSGNPPTGDQTILVNSTLTQVASGAKGLQAPPASSVYWYDAKIGSSLSWNSGVQMALPWSSSLDVSYVGTHNFNSVAFGAISTPGGYLPIDQNAPDVGAAFLPQNQDGTKAASAVPGQRAYATDFLRPFRGLGAITTTWPRFHTQYDSIQTSYTRRFSHGWQAGLNWTLGLRFTGNTLTQQHFEHAADGTMTLASYQAANDALINNVGLRRHVVKGNFVWDMPDLKKSDSVLRVVGLIVNDWQLSGVFTGGSGAPYDAGYTYSSGGSNINLTGSPSYAARIALTGQDPGKGCSSDQYRQFNVAAYSGPVYSATGSRGNESGVNLLTGCPDHTMDLAIQRNIRLGGNRQVQFRMDMFNAFNTVVWNARQTTIQWTSPDNQGTILNNQFNADGSLNTARLLPNSSAGAGAVTGAQAMRSMQLQIRFQF